MSNIYNDNYIASCCWNIFSSKYTYSNITYRNMLSFLRELAVILQVNANNIEDKESVPFVLYAAFYAANVSLFRANSFASCISTLDSQWKNLLYGFHFSDQSEQVQKHLYYQFMGAIYYQASFKDVSGELFFDILDDAISNNNYELVLDRVCSNYFLNNTEEAIKKVLERKKQELDSVATIFSKIMDERVPRIKDNHKFWADFYSGFIVFLIEKSTGTNIHLGGVDVCNLLKKLIINYLCHDYFAIKTFLRYVLLVMKYHLLLDTRANNYFCESYLNSMLDVMLTDEVCKTISSNFQLDNSHSADISEEISVVLDSKFAFKSIHLSLNLTEINSFVLCYLSADSAFIQEKISNYICINPVSKSDEELFAFVESYPVYEKARIFFKNNIFFYDIISADFISCFIKYSLNQLNKIHTLLVKKERFLYFTNLVYKYFMLCMYKKAHLHENLSFDALMDIYHNNLLGKSYTVDPKWTPFINYICIFYSLYLEKSDDVSRKLLSILDGESRRLTRNVTSGYSEASAQASVLNTTVTSKDEAIHKKTLFNVSLNSISDDMNIELSTAMKAVCYIYGIIMGKKKKIDISETEKELFNLFLESVYLEKNNEKLENYLLH